MRIQFISTKEFLLLGCFSDYNGSCFYSGPFASEIYPNGIKKIAGLYHVMNEDIIESDAIELKISKSDHESLLLYRIAQKRNHYFEFNSYFIGGKQLPISLWISTGIPILDELFRETDLIEWIIERKNMGFNPVVVGGDYPNAMPMTFFLSNPFP